MMCFENKPDCFMSCPLLFWVLSILWTCFSRRDTRLGCRIVCSLLIIDSKCWSGAGLLQHVDKTFYTNWRRFGINITQCSNNCVTAALVHNPLCGLSIKRVHACVTADAMFPSVWKHKPVHYDLSREQFTKKYKFRYHQLTLVLFQTWMQTCEWLFAEDIVFHP